MQPALFPAGVEASTRLEVVAQEFCVRGAAARPRGPLDEADRDAARGQKRGGRQPADAATDDNHLEGHSALRLRSVRGRGP
jgi:hypothetical protein